MCWALNSAFSNGVGGLRVDRPTAADQIGRPNCRNGDLSLTKMAIEILDLAMTEIYVDVAIVDGGG